MCASAPFNSACMVLRDRWVAPASRHRLACSTSLSWSRTEYSRRPSNWKSVRSLPTSSAACRMIWSPSSRPPRRARHGEPAVGDAADAPQRRRIECADPDRNGPLRSGRKPGVVEVVERPVEGHALLRPQSPQHRDLLLQECTPLVEGHAERVVLQLVPPDPEPETEATATEQVELDGLLREQRGLALRADQDGCREPDVREGSQVREHRERLAERMVDAVGTAEVAEHRGVPAEHVVVGREVRVAEVRDRLSEGAHSACVVAELGLGEDGADFHAGSLPATWWSRSGRGRPTADTSSRRDLPPPYALFFFAFGTAGGTTVQPTQDPLPVK